MTKRVSRVQEEAKKTSLLAPIAAKSRRYYTTLSPERIGGSGRSSRARRARCRIDDGYTGVEDDGVIYAP